MEIREPLARADCRGREMESRRATHGLSHDSGYLRPWIVEGAHGLRPCHRANPCGLRALYNIITSTIVGLICALVCVMGAGPGATPNAGVAASTSSLSFDAGQPQANPGGVAQILSATGTYTVDPAETFSNITYYSRNTGTKQKSSILATAANNKWNAKLGLVPGNYDSWGGMATTVNATGAVNVILNPNPPAPNFNSTVK